jgi:L-malate glycosyltransferase
MGSSPPVPSAIMPDRTQQQTLDPLREPAGLSLATRPTICQVLLTLGIGGAEVLASRLAHRLRDHHRFVFICLDEVNILGDQLRQEGFPVHYVGRQPGFDWRCALRIASVLRNERVDLVHAHQYTPFFYALTARLRYRRPPIVFTEHGRPFPDEPRRKRITANRLLLERRDRVISVGGAVRRALIDNEGFPPNRVEIIYNGVDLTAFTYQGPERDPIRAQLGVAPDDLLLVQAARLDVMKDHGTSLRTMERLIRERPGTHLALIGSGDKQEEVEAEIAQRGLGRHVHLLGRRQDVARFLSAADVFLLTSISEGIPLTLIEAMGAELPVVSTEVGGVSEVVVAEKTGLLAPAGDDGMLAEHILRLAQDSVTRRSMGRAGRVRALQLFSEAHNHERYLQLYAHMLDGRVFSPSPSATGDQPGLDMRR